MKERADFSAGDTVRIRTGAFAACAGRVVSVDHERRRLAVRVDLKVVPGSDSQTLDLRFGDVEKIRFPADD